MKRASTQQSGPSHLVFITEGKLEQVIGIAYILNVLLFVVGRERFTYPVWIVTTKEGESKTAKWLSSSCGDLDFRFVIAKTKSDDKYYIQLGIIPVIERLNTNEIILHLDYDHIILNPSRFPISVPNSNVLVSSEVYNDIARELKNPSVRLVEANELPCKHLNISLLSGSVSLIGEIANHWPQSYDYICPWISVRHRVELSFTLAAQRAGIEAQPCDVSVQGNFLNSTTNCFAFHYGGESLSSAIMKKRLDEESRSIIANSFRADDVHRIGQIMTDSLIDLLEKS